MVSDELLYKYYRMKAEELERKKKRKLFSMYPDEGRYSRFAYQKHIDFFRLGKRRQRLFVAGNRVGKTTGGAYEMAMHLTGLYEDWWREEDGYKKFDRPVKAWGAGDTNESTKAILQLELFGEPQGVKNRTRWVTGEGMIPLHLIEEIKWKSGFKDLIGEAKIRHASGGLSTLEFKAYSQGRKLFQGTAIDVIWFDEEPAQDVYGEAVLRTTTTGGIVYMTFTPLQGVTETVKAFLPEGHVKEYDDGNKAVVNMTWEDAPHLDEATKAELLEEIPPHMRDARTKGLPSLGSGAIYRVPESDVFIDDFPVPVFWPRAFAMDVGWNWNACLWLAVDRDNGVGYIYSEAKMSHVEPETFVKAIKARGKWINGVIDPASGGSNQFDGRELKQEYEKMGLTLSPADNAVEAGLFETYKLLVSGRLKIFKSCVQTQSEYRLYQRDKKGKVKKENDHCMDCMRYLVTSGFNVASIDPDLYDPEYKKQFHRRDGFDLNEFL
ncbi:large terminase protein [Caudoviricetes sp.]|nr:large terminase protein [Caudoviricetes sp.]